MLTFIVGQMVTPGRRCDTNPAESEMQTGAPDGGPGEWLARRKVFDGLTIYTQCKISVSKLSLDAAEKR